MPRLEAHAYYAILFFAQTGPIGLVGRSSFGKCGSGGAQVISELNDIARTLVAPGKGILAADETPGTLTKRFEVLGIQSTPESRRTYREMLFGAYGASEFISGVILQDETIRQTSRGGLPFAQMLTELGLAPGIKVDAGAKPLAGSPGETVTEGLDGLRERLAEYRKMGARFAKWRAVFRIDGDRLPSRACIHANSHALARYAALSQEAGIVPIVEPEVLMDGDHGLSRSNDVTCEVLEEVFNELFVEDVQLEGILLKPSMVIPGSATPETATHQDVAQATLRCLLRHVPAAVPGIVFLSGGQSPTLATAHLDAINRLQWSAPWTISFSYGRALQDPALEQWGGSDDRLEVGARALLQRARCNSAAALGAYSPAMETNSEFDRPPTGTQPATLDH